MFDWTLCNFPFACCCPTPDDRGSGHVQTLGANDHTNDGLFGHNHTELRDLKVLKDHDTNLENHASMKNHDGIINHENHVPIDDDPSKLLRMMEPRGEKGHVSMSAAAAGEDCPQSETTMLNHLKDLKAKMESEGDKSSKDILKDFGGNSTVSADVEGGIDKRLAKFNAEVERTLNYNVLRRLENGEEPVVSDAVTRIQDILKINDFFKQGSEDLKEDLTGLVEAMIAKHERGQHSTGVEVPRIVVERVN